ncbi:transcriptional regulator MntR [Calderihabitans maritimus]|uniref:transcriptional regulator MntR n=1 Tax=Calderihabitans maritimus TaxID=1246530 RepID=UPI001EDCE849|nr:transcriptional regulator MntR [Calderihabitans maritimus]
MSKKEKFYTVRGYALMKQNTGSLTPSMEDYLEMTFRLSIEKGFVRVNELAETLNVQPPSVTKMVQKLADRGLLHYEKYGLIKLTEEGNKLGRYLLQRHNTIKEFLQLIGVKEGLHEDTEKIEHSVRKTTMECLLRFIEFLKQEPAIMEKFYRTTTKN